jgi:uncharacterized membrane protein
MMGTNYALSEAVLLAIACWATIKLCRKSQFTAAAAAFLFGLAAAIGTWRFATGAVTQLATFHQTISQFGGIIGLGLFAICFFRLSNLGPLNKPVPEIIGLVTALFTITAFVLPGFSPIFVIILSLIGILSVFLLEEKNSWRQLGPAAVYGIFLANLLFIRKAPWLDPVVSWHAFHLVLAIWLMLTTRLILNHISESKLKENSAFDS